MKHADCATTNLNFPPEYLKIVPHPHSCDPTIQIVLLSTSTKVTTPFLPKPNICPWAPFKNLADFEYTETAVRGLLSKELVDTQLAGINSTWAAGSLLSIKSYRDMENILSKACKYFIQVYNHILLYYYHSNQVFETNISSRPKLSWPHMKVSLAKLCLSIEILGNGSWHSSKMNR